MSKKTIHVVTVGDALDSHEQREVVAVFTKLKDAGAYREQCLWYLNPKVESVALNEFVGAKRVWRCRGGYVEVLPRPRVKLPKNHMGWVYGWSEQEVRAKDSRDIVRRMAER